MAMVSKDTQYQVLMEALQWFRLVMRRDTLEPYEKGLFEAVGLLRQELDSKNRFPPPPPLPSIDSYSSKSTIKDMAAPPATYRNYDELPTIPVPMNEYESLVVEMSRIEKTPSK